MEGQALGDSGVCLFLMIHLLIKDLKSIKLKATERNFVVKCENLLQSSGTLGRSDASKLRKLHSKNRKRIAVVEEARERARISMMREREGFSKSDIKEIRDKFEEEKAELDSDLGI